MGVVGTPKVIVVNDDESIFGLVASNGCTLHELLKNELGLFRHLFVKLDQACLWPLTWWKSHEVRFSNVSFIAWQILGILGSHIEIKRIFSLVGVLTSLQHYKLGVDNLNKLVMVMKKFGHMMWGKIICGRGIPLMIFLRKKRVLLKRIIRR